MQFTGLKDKNGKEIYEGDIVTDGYERVEIKEMDGQGVYPFTKLHPSHYEIIGNIYENKDLLPPEEI